MSATIDIDDSIIKNLTTLDTSSLFPKSIQYSNHSFPEEPERIKSKEKWKYKFAEKQTTIQFPEPILYGLALYSNILGAVGGQTVAMYDMNDNTKIVEFIISNNELYCISITTNEVWSTLICAVGGQSPIIRVIDIINEKEMPQLIGHKNEIYDLKFHPINSNLLLSASKDNSIRLWNVITQQQICIYGGPMGHAAEVLSLSWHENGTIFASSGIDNCVKLFEITSKIEKKIANEKGDMKTLLKSNPYFSCTSVHDNYIDCIQFNGNLLLSKSVDGVIKEWFPMLNKEGDYFYLMNTYPYATKEKIWYVKFIFDQKDNLMLVGNDCGQCFLFQVRNSENFIPINNSNTATVKEDDVLDLKNGQIIRAMGYSPEMQMAAIGNCKGEIILIGIKKEIQN